MAWLDRVLPSDIVRQVDGGFGDMGDVTVIDSAARFFLPDIPYLFLYLRLHFEGGTGTAPLSLKLSRWNHELDGLALWNFTGDRGTGNDVHFRLPADEPLLWIFQPGEIVVLEWTNPDNGNMRWSAEVGLVRANIDPREFVGSVQNL